MKFCSYCNRNVRPQKTWSWVGFIFGFGILYFIYYIMKAPKCPICGARMGMIKRG